MEQKNVKQRWETRRGTRMGNENTGSTMGTTNGKRVWGPRMGNNSWKQSWRTVMGKILENKNGEPRARMGNKSENKKVKQETRMGNNSWKQERETIRGNKNGKQEGFALGFLQ